ncbi:MAG TPA: glycosyltransferase family 4 protein [Candidatus Scatovivens faecipullorum]|nr:glycosyltransferase family 4 protein [Candidatus Scatovivens faecipullorum]
MKKKIVVIANFTRLPWEKGNSRFPYIINLINKEKFDVELITSRFFHGEKKHRKDSALSENLDYKITLIDEPGYKRNVSIKRFLSHKIFAKNVKRYLETINKPDVIYSAIPSLDVAKVAGEYAEKNNIKFIIDIQDLWPEAFEMIFKVPILKDLIFYPMRKKADKIYSMADSIIGVSNTYADRAGIVNKKYKHKLAVFLGTDLDYFDKSHNEHEIITFDNVFRIAYIGTLGNSYDIKCVIDAIKILKDKGINNILFEVMGSGPLKIEFEKYAKQKGVNCEFTGRLNYEEMVGYLCICDIAVNPIKKDSAASIINKVGDYAAAGIPVLNTQESIEYKKLVEDYQIGYNIENGNSEDLAEAIEYLYKNENLRKRLGENNRKLAEEKFDRKITYYKIKEIIEEE